MSMTQPMVVYNLPLTSYALLPAAESNHRYLKTESVNGSGSQVSAPRAHNDRLCPESQLNPAIELLS